MSEMKQLTRDEAIQIAKSGIWKKWTDREIAFFQLQQSKLCLDFDRFHKAVEGALDRSVWTHEFGNYNRLFLELVGLKEQADFEEVMDKLPKDKPKIIAVIK